MRMSRRTSVILFIAVVVCLMMAAPAFAQEDTTIVLPSGSPLDEAVQALLEQLVALVNVPFAASLIVVLTAVLKRLPPLTNVSAGIIALVLNTLFWVGWFVARHFNFEEGYRLIVESLAPILAAIFGLSVTGIAASMLYVQNVKWDVPLLGYSRSAPMIAPAVEHVSSPFAPGDTQRIPEEQIRASMRYDAPK